MIYLFLVASATLLTVSTYFSVFLYFDTEGLAFRLFSLSFFKLLFKYNCLHFPPTTPTYSSLPHLPRDPLPLSWTICTSQHQPIPRDSK